MTLIHVQDNIDQAKAEALANAIPVIITDITGTAATNEDLSKVAVYEDVDITLTGSMDIEDQSFPFPLTRNDGRVCLFYAEVVSKVLTVVVNVEETGVYRVTTDTINSDPDYPDYKIDTISFEVLRDTAAAGSLINFSFGLLNK